MDQKNVFMDSEGDRWFERNAKALHQKTPDNDKIVALLKRMDARPQNVLEIGCSNGWRLALIEETFHSKCFGVEPSQSAINEGKTSHPTLSLTQGTADTLPYEKAQFDAVICGFCLYLCDRSDLFKIASEIDRVLDEKGLLIIYDFYSSIPYRNRYTHSALDIYSYKMDYEKMFTWSPTYRVVEKKIFDHSGTTPNCNPDEAVSVVILQKTSESAYIDNPYTRHQV